MANEIEILKGWTLPFFPMRPAKGYRLTPDLVLDVLGRMANHRFIYQPKLKGDRALLGVVGRKVVVCTRNYDWYPYQVENATSYLAKMGDGSLFDGVVSYGSFYPFECLAFDGRSLKCNTVEEREIIAMQMCRLCGIEWLFRTPTKKWLLAGRANSRYEGVIRKRAGIGYAVQTNASETNSNWTVHLWK
jgi:hypothetical protein